MYRLTIFDLDGTLLNTLDDLTAAGNYALAKMGFPIYPSQAYKKFVGSGVKNLFRRAIPLEYHNDMVLQSLLTHFFTYYDTYGEQLTKPYQGIPGLLQELKRQNIMVAVLSNKPHRYVPMLTQRFFPGLIDLAYGQREGVPIKPDPQALLELCKQLGCSLEYCAYIGDSDVDMQTGVNAGITAFGVTWGYRAHQELVSAGAAGIANTPQALQEMLLI